jgi:hypothetical protein
MKRTEDSDSKEPAPKHQKVRKVSPLGNLDQDSPNRDDKPQDEFIEQKSNKSKSKE